VNYCRACRQDFGSLSAFDAHRVGKHEYVWSPEQEDGRRLALRYVRSMATTSHRCPSQLHAIAWSACEPNFEQKVRNDSSEVARVGGAMRVEESERKNPFTSFSGD
jgi:hypothetical protein